jgi:hypothetical protein
MLLGDKDALKEDASTAMTYLRRALLVRLRQTVVFLLSIIIATIISRPSGENTRTCRVPFKTKKLAPLPR